MEGIWSLPYKRDFYVISYLKLECAQLSQQYQNIKLIGLNYYPNRELLKGRKLSNENDWAISIEW